MVSREDGDEPSDFIKDREFLDHLSDSISQGLCSIELVNL
jgi:hypothetical protein